MAMCWFFAALNSIEPPFMNLAEVDFFIADERKKVDRRPEVLKAVEAKLAQLARALGSRPYLAGDQTTIADMMMSSVLKILHHTDLLSRFPTLMLYRDRGFDRPAYKKAIADQCADIARHQEHDMKYKSKKPELTDIVWLFYFNGSYAALNLSSFIPGKRLYDTRKTLLVLALPDAEVLKRGGRPSRPD